MDNIRNLFNNDIRSLFRNDEMHVEKGAFVAAVLGSALTVAFAFLGFVQTIGLVTSPAEGIPISNEFDRVLLFLYLTVIYALQKRDPVLFLPYLIIQGVSLIHTFGLLVYSGTQIYAYTFVLPALIAFFIGIARYIVEVWFYTIIFRAYMHVKGGGSGEGRGAVPLAPGVSAEAPMSNA